ncbi:hypothetical protein VTI74DRAFT_11490 [Chaetomium olivicolor]
MHSHRRHAGHRERTYDNLDTARTNEQANITVRSLNWKTQQQAVNSWFLVTRLATPECPASCNDYSIGGSAVLAGGVSLTVLVLEGIIPTHVTDPLGSNHELLIWHARIVGSQGLEYLNEPSIFLRQLVHAHAFHNSTTRYIAPLSLKIKCGQPLKRRLV